MPAKPPSKPTRPADTARKAAGALLHMQDLSPVDVVLAVLIANALPGDPVWLGLVKAPSRGKTELLLAAGRTPKAYLLSTLTRRTFISGAKASKSDEAGEEPSLLDRLKGRVLVLKDFGTILSEDRHERNAILGQLREIYDGRMSKAFGTGKQYDWQGKVGLLMGVTAEFDRHSAAQAILGERFILYRIPGDEREERRGQARKALKVAEKTPELRQRFAKAMLSSYQKACGWMEESRDRIRIPPALEETLVVLADIAAYGRAGVVRDGYSREVLYVPEPEGPARLTKQLRLMTVALTIVHGKVQPDEEELGLIRKIARDTMHPFRARVLAALAHGDMGTADLAKATGLTYQMAEREAQDCALLGLVSGDKDLWKLDPRWREDIRACRIFEGFLPTLDGQPSQLPESAGSRPSRTVPPEGERGGGIRGHISGVPGGDLAGWLGGEVIEPTAQLAEPCGASTKPESRGRGGIGQPGGNGGDGGDGEAPFLVEHSAPCNSEKKEKRAA